MADPVIRRYQPTDRADMYDVCLRTADAGRDATHLYQDPQLVGDVFAVCYAYLEPDFAFVLDDGDRVTGYVVGTPDTARFVDAVREKWLPLVADRHPEPAGPPVTRDDEMRYVLHHPEHRLHPALADHPAHLHIDLLPECQRSGHGRRLMFTLLSAFHQAGAPRVHLTMSTENTAARAFYDRVGFHEITVDDNHGLAYLGRSTEV